MAARKKVMQRQPRGRGAIVARGDGCWLVRMYVGSATVDGITRRKYVAKTIKGTYRQADKARTRMLREQDTGTFVEPAKVTLREYLTGYRTEVEETANRNADIDAGAPKGWLDTIAGVRVAQKTLNGYRDALRLHVLPTLGGLKLDVIQPRHIEVAYAGMTHRGLSPRTIRLTHTVLKNAMKHAVRRKMLAQNPCEDVVLPRQIRKEMKALSGEQVCTLLEVARAKQDDLIAFWHVLLMTGLRPAEARALKWADLVGTQLCIQRSMVETEKGAYVFGETKTGTSRRTVDIPQATVAALQAHRQQQLGHILATGARYSRQDLIFANAVGNPLDQSRLRRRWKAALAAAELPTVRLYDTRHTHASVLLSEGLNPKVVAERLGHASINMTLDIYSHVLPRVAKDTADKLDQLLNRNAG